MWGNYSPVHCWWDCKIMQSLWKMVRWSSKIKQNYHVSQQLHPWVYTQKMWEQGLKYQKTSIWTPRFAAAWFTIAKKVEAPQVSTDDETQVSTDGWINKKCVVSVTMESHSALKGKEVLTHAITWMKLENIKLSEISPPRPASFPRTRPLSWGAEWTWKMTWTPQPSSKELLQA